MLILASKSPRRKELLQRLGIPFEICVSDADESLCCPHTPEETVRLLALRKAQAVSENHPDDIVLGVDTVVAIDGRILGKPKDDREAKAMLSLLSGRTHDVYSGYALVGNGKTAEGCVRTSVRFAPLSPEEIDRYVATGEPADKAGAYGIQGAAGAFVTGISGDYHAVMGLPLHEVYRTLKNDFKVEFPWI